MDMKLKVVYEVRGDFGNIGDGEILGIFETKAEAEKNAEGCGSLDCGGDGLVWKRFAVPDGAGGFYLLDSDRVYKVGAMEPSDAKVIHAHGDVVELILMSIRDKAAAVRTLRDLLPTNLRDAKRMADGAPCVVARGGREYVSGLADALVASGNAVELRDPDEEA